VVTAYRTRLGRQIVEDAKRFVSTRGASGSIAPIRLSAPKAYFWDYDGNRLDFASQLVNVSIGHSHPKIVQAIKDQAESSRDRRRWRRSRLGRLLAESPGDLTMTVANGGAGRMRTRSSWHGTPAATRSLLAPELPRRDRHAITLTGDPPLALSPDCRVSFMFDPYLPLPGRSIRVQCAGGSQRSSSTKVRTPCGGDSRDRHGTNGVITTGRLSAVDSRDVRPPRDPVDLRRGDGRPAARQVVRRRQLGRHATS
jgi:hypothetical protein